MKNNGLFYRDIEIQRDSFNEEGRYVDLSFSSEKKVRTYIHELGEEGDEILLHGPKNVSLKRLKEMGSGLFNHNPNVIIGPLKNIAIRDKKGVARLVFDDDEDGNKAMGKVKSGSLRGVSVGAMVSDVKVIKRGEEFEGHKGPAILGTQWTPHELSLTPIPKDDTVGVGRSLETIMSIERTNKTKTEEMEMDENDVQKMIEASLSGLRAEMPKAEDIVTQLRAVLAEDAKPKMQVTAETLQDLLGRAQAVSLEMKSTISDMAASGGSELEMLRTIQEGAINPDASDAGGDGDGLKEKKRTLEKMDNKEFFSAIKDVTLLQTEA